MSRDFEADGLPCLMLTKPPFVLSLSKHCPYFVPPGTK